MLHGPHACPPLPSGFTTNPVILENDGVKCNIKSLTQLATAVGTSPSCSPCMHGMASPYHRMRLIRFEIRCGRCLTRLLPMRAWDDFLLHIFDAHACMV